jgi:hypothetical protein
VIVTPELAELLGMHAGDGSLYRANGGVVWELRGNKDEKEFYDGYIASLLRKVTSIPFTFQERSGGKNGCYGVRCCRKEFGRMLLAAGFAIGKKTHTVDVPPCVLTGNLEVRAAFLRGLFATDGTGYLMRANHEVTASYPAIELCSASQALRDHAAELLKALGIGSYVWTYCPKQRGGPVFFLRVCGAKRVKLFAERVGLSNPKHQLRLAPSLQANSNI